MRFGATLLRFGFMLGLIVCQRSHFIPPPVEKAAAWQTARPKCYEQLLVIQQGLERALPVIGSES